MPYLRQLIIESLRYWAREMHVDGFRFDLASVFTRNDDGSINLDNPAIFGDIADDPDLAGARMIAEPWDVSIGGNELGRKFPGISWRQWNDRFRTTLRRFVKGDSDCLPDLMTRLYGSDDLFPDLPLLRVGRKIRRDLAARSSRRHLRRRHEPDGATGR